MKLSSYITLVFGILLLSSSIIFDFSGMIGYLLTLLSVILIIVGIFMNKVLRQFFINIFINFF